MRYHMLAADRIRALIGSLAGPQCPGLREIGAIIEHNCQSAEILTDLAMSLPDMKAMIDALRIAAQRLHADGMEAQAATLDTLHEMAWLLTVARRHLDTDNEAVIRGIIDCLVSALEDAGVDTTVEIVSGKQSLIPYIGARVLVRYPQGCEWVLFVRQANAEDDLDAIPQGTWLIEGGGNLPRGVTCVEEILGTALPKDLAERIQRHVAELHSASAAEIIPLTKPATAAA